MPAKRSRSNVTSSESQQTPKRRKNPSGPVQQLDPGSNEQVCNSQVNICDTCPEAHTHLGIQRVQQLRDVILNILGKRRAGSTCCPSEAPRQLCPEDWRPMMDMTRQAAKELVQDGKIEVTQKGQVVDISNVKGPIRLRMIHSDG